MADRSNPLSLRQCLCRSSVARSARFLLQCPRPPTDTSLRATSRSMRSRPEVALHIQTTPVRPSVALRLQDAYDQSSRHRSTASLLSRSRLPELLLWARDISLPQGRWQYASPSEMCRSTTVP